jgi:hypothetical protein
LREGSRHAGHPGRKRHEGESGSVHHTSSEIRFEIDTFGVERVSLFKINRLKYFQSFLLKTKEW